MSTVPGRCRRIRREIPRPPGCGHRPSRWARSRAPPPASPGPLSAHKGHMTCVISTQRSHDQRYLHTKVTWPTLFAHKGHMTCVICTQRSHDLRYLHTKVTWPALSAHKGHMTCVTVSEHFHNFPQDISEKIRNNVDRSNLRVPWQNRFGLNPWCRPYLAYFLGVSPRQASTKHCEVL